MSEYKGQTSKNTYSWEITSDDGIHTVDVNFPSAWVTAFNVSVDGNHLLSVSAEKPEWKSIEIPCGGETLTLVYFRARMDIVHRGMLVKKNIPYRPEDTLPKSHSVPFIITSILSVVWCYILSKYILGLDALEMLSFLCFASAFIAFCSSIVIKQNANSPLLTKQKKKLYIWLSTIWSIGTSTIFPLMFWAISLLDSIMI